MISRLPASQSSVAPDATLQPFTVQCGFGSWMACVVVVQATSIEAACSLAIEEANNSPAWKSVDSCTPTIVDAIAEGQDAQLWTGVGSTLPVPAAFTEDAEARTLRLALSRLLDWASDEGGCNEPCWTEARALLQGWPGQER